MSFLRDVCFVCYELEIAFFKLFDFKSSNIFILKGNERCISL